MVKNPPASAGDVRYLGLIPGLVRTPGGGHSNPLQYSCLKNSMDRGAWWVTAHRIAKSWTRLSCLSMHTVALGGEDFTVPISQMRKLRPGEVDWLVPGYTAGDGLILG